MSSGKQLSSPYRHLIASIASSSRKAPRYLAKRTQFSDSPYQAVEPSDEASPDPANGNVNRRADRFVNGAGQGQPNSSGKGKQQSQDPDPGSRQGSGGNDGGGPVSNNGSWSPTLLQRYESFQLRHVSMATQLEAALASLLCMMPSRFGGGGGGGGGTGDGSDSSDGPESSIPSPPVASGSGATSALFEGELQAEGVYAGARLISLLNDVLVLRRAYSSAPTVQRRFGNASPTEHGLLAVLSVVRCLELSCEMVALDWAPTTAATAARDTQGDLDQRRWTVVLALESLKAIVRLALLKVRGHRMLVRHDLVSRDDLVGPAVAPNLSAATATELTQEANRLWYGKQQQQQQQKHQSPSTGSPNRRRPTFADVRQSPAAASSSTSALSADPFGAGAPLTGQTLLGELLWIVRPVVLASLRVMRSTGGGGQTGAWARLLVAFLIDLVSHRLSSSSSSHSASSSSDSNKVPKPLTAAERAELNRRRALWLLYGLHSPAFDLLSELGASVRSSLLDPIPGVSTVSRLFGSYLSAMSRLYYFHAGT